MTTKSKKRGRRPLISFWCLPFVILYLLFAARTAYLKVDKPFLWLAYAAIDSIVVFLISVLVAWVASKVARRGSRAASVTFGVLLILIMVGNLPDTVERNKQTNKDVTERLDGFAQQAKDLKRRELAGEDIGDESVQFLDKFSADMGDLAATKTGEDAIALRALSAMMASLANPTTQFVDAFQEFDNAGGWLPDVFKAEADIDARLQQLDELEQANDRLTSKCESLPDLFHDHLRTEGISPARAKQLTDGLRNGLAMKRLVRIRDTDRRLLTAGRQMLLVLEEQWGQWHYDEQEDLIVFDEDAVGETYDSHFMDFSDAVIEQERLQRLNLARQTGPR